MNYNFKNKYYSYTGTDLEQLYPCTFYYNMPVGTAGTRENPKAAKNGIILQNRSEGHILGGGIFKNIPITHSGTLYTTPHYITGQGVGTTFLGCLLTATPNKDTSMNTYFNQLSFTDSTFQVSVAGNQGTYSIYLQYCELIKFPNFIKSNYGTLQMIVSKCLIRDTTNMTNTGVACTSGNSFVNLSTDFSIRSNDSLHLFENTNITLNQSTITAAHANYLAFDNCRFKIGDETGHTALSGNTPDELRADFEARCTAQGIALTTSTEFDYTNVVQGRWIFTKDAAFEGIVYKDSDIHKFEQPRGIKLGYETKRVERIAVKAENNATGAFIPSLSNMAIAANSMTIPSEKEITTRHELVAQSNIIWLGGKHALKWSKVLNNINPLYGVNIDNTPNLNFDNAIQPGVPKIETGKFYILRSFDNEYAEIKYNNVSYNTSLASGNNIICGTSDATSFTSVSGKPVLFEILDELQYNTYQIRVVHSLPDAIIKSGNLQADTFYFVEHDNDQTNTSEYIIYKGVKYPVTGSFVTDTNNLTFICSSEKVHLRRCWKKEFDFDTETLDKSHWVNRQKPEWVDVVPDDLMCLLENNNAAATEMRRGTDGKYITSGHPEYYKLTEGSGSIRLQGFPITGTYIQFRIIVSTLNLM